MTCPDGEVTFEEEDMANAFIQLHGTERTPEQVAAWSAIGSCPNCGNGDLDIEHLDGEEYEADCKDAIEKQNIVDNFAKKLLEDQQPIPPEFAQILADNFWDLVL